MQEQEKLAHCCWTSNSGPTSKSYIPPAQSSPCHTEDILNGTTPEQEFWCNIPRSCNKVICLLNE